MPGWRAGGSPASSRPSKLVRLVLAPSSTCSYTWQVGLATSGPGLLQAVHPVHVHLPSCPYGRQASCIFDKAVSILQEGPSAALATPALSRAARVLERMENQNLHREMAMDFKVRHRPPANQGGVSTGQGKSS